ncbi:MAG: carbohydrate kinase [Pseudomonadota bacterium]
MTDVLCLGEILVDWICTIPGAELSDAHCFTKAPGGAPANTAVGLARQGIPTAFIGRVADDGFGLWLRNVLEKEGIDTQGVITDTHAQTRMAYVVTTLTGDRKLAEFSRISCADERLSVEDLQEKQFEHAKVLHFGSISLITPASFAATTHAVKLARQHNVLVSYDPNIRLNLWPSAEACKQIIFETFSWADVVKINDDELFFLTGNRDLNAADQLREAHNIPLLLVTLDSRGAYLSSTQGSQLIPGFGVELIEATGAGDGFNAGVITGLLPYLKTSSNHRETLSKLDLNTLTSIVRRANASGALTCTKAGAMTALPNQSEIEAFLAIHMPKEISNLSYIA